MYQNSFNLKLNGISVDVNCVLFPYIKSSNWKEH